MPKVGGKHYAYTKAGNAAAKKEAKRSGRKAPVIAKPKKR